MLRQQPRNAPPRTNIHDAKRLQRDRRQGEGGPQDLTSTFPMRTVDGENVGAVQLTAVDLAFDADDRPEACDAFGKSGVLGRQDDGADILIGAGGFLGDAAH